MIHDLRYAVRTLLRTPTFTLVVVLTLALGIGASTAIFSVVDAVLLRPVPFEAMDRLLMVWETDRNSGTTREPSSVPDFLDFQERSQQIETLAALMGAQVNAATDEGEPVRLTALAVSHELLPVLGVGTVLGRTFTPEEDRPGGPNAAIISEGLWTRRFGGDSDVLGRVLLLDDVPYTIVGVAPEGADLGVLQILSAAAYARAFADRGTRADVDIWVPLQADPESFPRFTHPIFVVGRLAPTATVASAQDELSVIAADLERAYPENNGRGVFVEPLTAVVFGPVRPALLVLLGAVALVLLVACANVANLVLARATTRLREMAVRQALGAGVRRLASQFMVESLLLTVVATMAGVAFAAGGLEILVGLAPADIPRLGDVRLDGRVLAVALALSLGVGITFGMVPIAQAWRVDLQSALKGDLRIGGAIGWTRRGARRVLVVVQVALAVVLVIGAGLLVRSFGHLLEVEPGFRAGGVLKAEYQLPDSRYPTNMALFPSWTEVRAFNDALLQRAASLTGVESAALAGNHPLDQGSTNSFVVIGREAEAREWPEISVRRVTSEYFATVGLSLMRGRLLRETDDAFAPAVALINEAAARRFFPDRDPLGQQLGFWGARRTIVGVVANERFHGLAQAPPLATYLSLAQAPSTAGAYSLLVRAGGDPAALARPVRRIVRELDPALAVFGVEPLDETLSRSVAQRRFIMTLLGLFAALGIVLAVVGIHGALSYDVAQRTREIGIRMALGARPARITALIMGEGLRLTFAGLLVGLASAAALSRLLSALLFGIEPLDPATFLAVPVMVVGVALAACSVAARRAATVDPVTALRAE